MNNFSQMFEKTNQFQSGFAKIIKELQVEANKYNNCFNEAYKDIIDFYNKLSLLSNKMNQQQINNNKEQLQCKNTIEKLKKRYNELSEQLNVFNQNVLQYQMQKFEFDNDYLQFQLSQMNDKGLKLVQNNPLVQTSPIQFDIFHSLTFQLNQIVDQQNNLFIRNEQFCNLLYQQTQNLQTQIENRKQQQQQLIKEQIEEQQRKQLEIQKQKEELEQNTHNDTDPENEIDENLSEAEELTQLCQECGQTIKFNNFLTKCLHYYHEECILQKIKANYQSTSIYCSCNTLINSRMIKDVLEHCKQDQNQISFEIFQYHQIKYLLKKSNKNYTECKCGFIYISDRDEKVDNCLDCDKVY